MFDRYLTKTEFVEIFIWKNRDVTMAAANNQFENNVESKEIVLGKKIAEIKKRLILAGKFVKFHYVVLK